MSKDLTPSASAVIGFLLALPFIIVNFIVALRIEPFYSFLGSFPAVRNSSLFPLLLLLLFPIGAYIVIRPMLQKAPDGKRKIYLVNSVLGAIMLLVFLVLFIALGEETYRCDILKIPNCD